MEPRDYLVKRIDGEYAYLVEIGQTEELCVALFLLPEGTDVSSKLHYEMLTYTLLD